MEDSNGQISKEFQLSDLSIAEKLSPEWGMKVSQMIAQTVYSGLGGYYFDRNARFTKNRNYANARLDIKAMFADRFQFNGKENYLNIGWQTVQIVNRIISGLVGRWMGRNEKIVVEAKDSISVKQKQEEFNVLQMYVMQREKMLQLQKESGEKIMPDNTPEDIDELMLWQSQFQRLPEEILTEIECNDVMDANGLFSTLKEKKLWDYATVGLGCSYTWMDNEGVIHTDYVKPENAIYSYSEFPDFRDTSWRGQAPTMKISQIRKEYGKEFGGTLTEQELWEIAATSKNYQKSDNITWLDQWTNMYMRPYDEWNVDCIKFEIKSVDSEKYTITTTKATSRTILEKGLPKTKQGNIRQKPADNQEILDDSNWNIYQGVYLPQSKKLLKWGIKKNMIRPGDPKEIGNAEFSYSFYMPQNYRMRNVAIPEKIEQPVNGMILCLLKIEQVVAKSRPPGAMINTRAMQNMDFGLGDKKNREIDQKKLFDQTGDIYYYDLDAEGKPIGIPITEIPNAGFLPAIQGWIQTYQFHYQTLKDQLGEDPNLISQALQPRVTSQNVETSQRSAENATDYMYDGYLYEMEDVSKKITCLMQKSVMFGASVYRELLGETDMANRVFTTTARMLPTEQEIMVLNDKMNAIIQSNPDAILYLDTAKIIRIAKEDVKLAEEYYRQCMKKMVQGQQQQAAQNAQLNAQSQQASLQQKGEFDLKMLEKKLEIEDASADKRDKAKLKQIALQGAFTVMASKEGDVKPEWTPVIEELINNIMIPMLSENADHTAALGKKLGQQPEQQGEQESPMENQQDTQPEQQPQQQAA